MNSSQKSFGSSDDGSTATLDALSATDRRPHACVKTCVACGVNLTKVIDGRNVCPDPSCESNTHRRSEHNVYGPNCQ